MVRYHKQCTNRRPNNSAHSNRSTSLGELLGRRPTQPKSIGDHCKPCDRTFEQRVAIKMTQGKTKADLNYYGTIWNRLIMYNN